ncbi:MAG: sigma-70 family RNA polymerase sigma factor, partial [Clostridia bacterium]|nr:sigma-70 family RNA polymerase sigma factor [Clostridia bacterium]
MFEFIAYILGKITFFAGTVLGAGSFPKPLSDEEEKECIKKMQAGDAAARDKLITYNMRLVAHIAKKYAGSADKDDLISVGSIGLIKAVDNFDTTMDVKFSTYAVPMILGEIRRYLR